MSTSTLTRPRALAEVPAQRRVAPTPGVTEPTVRPGVRLTRRGRLVVTVVLVGVLLAAFTAFSGWSSATGEAGAPVPTRVHVVSEGDTLWEIAAEVAEPGQIREVIHQIEKLNSLSSPRLVEGQELAIPVVPVD